MQIIKPVCLREKSSYERSHMHEVYTEVVNKIALSPSDDERHILEDQTHTLTLGHYKIFS